MGVPQEGVPGRVPLVWVSCRGSLVGVNWRVSPGAGPLMGAPWRGSSIKGPLDFFLSRGSPEGVPRGWPLDWQQQRKDNFLSAY
jgi:hypothetical protein